MNQFQSTPRIGIHLSTAGGVFTAAERAHEVGAGTFQIFTSSPRMWRAAKPQAEHCARMKQLRELYGIAPAVVHASYLINMCSQNDEVLRKSTIALRGEVERALAIGAEFLVLHPGSWKGMTREQGLDRAAAAIEVAVEGLSLDDECGFRLLIENTAGSDFSLGGSFDQVAELIERLKPHLPVGACLDTCHTHVSGYDIVSAEGYEETVRQAGATIGLANVRVWHTNDAKAARGSKLDRHEHIGEGLIGAESFGRLLHDERFAHCAFIAETPVDAPGDIEKNVRALLELAR
jgi:deoxyribonuclease-4